MKKVSIFGATGSIGQNTIDLVRKDRELFDVKVLTGGKNIKRLAEDANELKPDLVVTAHDYLYNDLTELIKDKRIEIAAGYQAICDVASIETDWVMSAIIGAAGLKPGVLAMEAGADLALANKESMVAAGPILKKTASKKNVNLIPVDSEHSAIFQLLIGQETKSVERVILTASGGAFRDWSIEELKKATPNQASKHPNWVMGQRITIDSASMFNKALEVIEAKEFFDLPPNQIEVLIHPQSLVHAFVGFCDGSLISHVGPADMRHAIGFALYYPKRPNLDLKRLNFEEIGTFEFYSPDFKKYPALRLAYEVLEIGGFAGAVYNSAKEIALDAFIDRKIKFTDMSVVVEMVLDDFFGKGMEIKEEHTLENVLKIDHMGRLAAQNQIKKLQIK